MKKPFLFLFVFGLLFYGCSKKESPVAEGAVVKFKYKFSPQQERLNNFGAPEALPAGNGGQIPDFHGMSVHFIELVPHALTPYQSGAFVYKGQEVPADNPNSFNFTTAIDFDQALVSDEDVVFLEVPIADLDPGTYNHIRASVTYQNYDVSFNLENVPGIGQVNDQSGTVASFVGFNTYIENLMIRNMELAVADFKLQGFWGFETNLSSPYESFNQIFHGQAPENSTTVVNPFPEAPIPLGSCVVSGSFDQPLVISRDVQEDIVITLSFSINNSFEWKDFNGNGEWDLDVGNPGNSEPVVDMGLRGLKAFVEQ